MEDRAVKTFLLILLMVAVNVGCYWLGWHNRDSEISVTVCQENLDAP